MVSVVARDEMEEKVQHAALPLQVQKLERALDMSCLLPLVDSMFSRKAIERAGEGGAHNRRLASNGCLYNFTHVSGERKWLQAVLLSDSDGSESELSETEQLQIRLELRYIQRKCWKKRLRRDRRLLRYKYLSAGLLSHRDRYPEHLRAVQLHLGGGVGQPGGVAPGLSDGVLDHNLLDLQREKEHYQQRLWEFIAKKEIPKMAKMFSTARHNVISNSRRVAQLCQREVRKLALKSQRASKDMTVQPRARRLMREALIYWRRYERVEKEARKKAEREAQEQRKADDEMREARRQTRKLNFLITQTELYAHFMAKKLTGEEDHTDSILSQLEDGPLRREVRPGMVVDLEQPSDYDSSAMKAQALANVQSALNMHEAKHGSYVELTGGGGRGGEEGGAGRRDVGPRGDLGPHGTTGETVDLQESFDQRFSLATPMLPADKDLPQPIIFRGLLKVYQLKGMNWLANLYDQGINGILADEMGLGKTVQSIALLAHLAERQSTWGPFLIVAPASTLHNWQQECARFVPRFKVLPYWGSPHERKIIRKYWNQKLLCKENAPFHVLITSYQLVVQDVKYFQRVKWQYMILDEAQAIKSSSSVRWKVLLSFSCRNRLLLTGTPIQNTMQELWALLHFIMPTMFDSHEEFNEWFSRDIESHAEKKSALDENQLSRLHMILKPFMLRRIKRDVEHEMAEKIEVHLSCLLSTRQQKLYAGLRGRISVEDLLQSSSAQATQRDSSSHLLNLVMQFRKVCNHPDLFERRDVKSPVSVSVSGCVIPRKVYHELHIVKPSIDRQRLLCTVLGLHSADAVHRSSLCSSVEASPGCWSFLRLTGLSVGEAERIMLGPLVARMCVFLHLMKRLHLLYQQCHWDMAPPPVRSTSGRLLLCQSFKASPQARRHSPALQGLLFTSHSQTLYTHTTHRVFPLQTSARTSAELTQISSTVSAHDSHSPVPSSTPHLSPASSSLGSSSKTLSATPSPQGRSGPFGAARSGSEGSEARKGTRGCLSGFSPDRLRTCGATSTRNPTSDSNTSNFVRKSLRASSQDNGRNKHSSPASRAGCLGGQGSSCAALNRNGLVGSLADAALSDAEEGAGEVGAWLGGGEEDSMAVGRESCLDNVRLGEVPHSEYRCVPTDMPKFLTAYIPKVEVPLGLPYCSDRGAEHARKAWQSGGPRGLRQLFGHGRWEGEEGDSTFELVSRRTSGGIDGVRPPSGWSRILIPDKENMIYDSGKMTVLDKLLVQLKQEGHRILIYSQMTRMIDLLEEFMAYRRYRYIRLDGSSRIADRRDMVDDFQRKSDIFVFLLSTRAGGLGINLTAADTVIFYDSDWNPTVDQQAMDRAHRLGQTKQVTVYRLIVKGTIEERIMQRAREKSEIQKMVISGGDFKPDTLKPKEMVSLLLDDDELETRLLAKQAEKRIIEQQGGGGGKKTKNRKRKNPDSNGKENEPFLKKPHFVSLASATPSPLPSSRPASVLSGTSDLTNGMEDVDVLGNGGGEGGEALLEASCPGSTPIRKRARKLGKTAAPLGGRGKMHRKKLNTGSGSAAASAGALAGALAANSVACAAPYALSPHYISPSPSSSVVASPAQGGGSKQSSPRASPVPMAMGTPPSMRAGRGSSSSRVSSTRTN